MISEKISVVLKKKKKGVICLIESPLTVMKNVFFRLKSSFRSQDI